MPKIKSHVFSELCLKEESGIYIPESFLLYHDHSSFIILPLILEYSGYKFRINYPEHHYDPYSFEINEKECDLFAIYYRYPKQIKGYRELENSEMNTLAESIEKAKILFGDNWDFRLSFGIMIFYYWISIYYQKKRDLYPVFHGILEKDAWC